MPNVDGQQIPPPANWQDFERLCRDLWAEVWRDANAQGNGRSGQQQHGVDISGRPNVGSKWAGVQCKGKTRGYGSAVTAAELKAEVAKARRFTPALREFIVATTAPKDARIEAEARAITDRHQKKRLFSVHVWGWEDVVQAVCRYPVLIDKHYPHLGPTLRKLARSIASIETRLRGGSSSRSPRNRKTAAGGSSRPPEARPLAEFRAGPLMLFVSSRMDVGLRRERLAVAKAVKAFGDLARAWLWEQDGVAGPSERSMCVATAGSTDVLVLLVQDDVSPIVRAEFNAAYAAGAICFVFTKSGRAATKRCRRFLATLAKRGILPLRFQNESELRTHVVQRLRGHIVGAVRAERRRA